MFCGICGMEFPDEFNFCPKCGRAVKVSTSEPKPQAADTVPVLAPSPPNNQLPPAQTVSAKTPFNYGTVVFAAFSVLSLLVSLIKGIVPLYLGESALWAFVAWYWHKKNHRSRAANQMVLLLAMAVVGGQAYLLGKRSTTTPRRPSLNSTLEDRMTTVPSWVPENKAALPTTPPDSSATVARPGTKKAKGPARRGSKGESSTPGNRLVQRQDKSEAVFQPCAEELPAGTDRMPVSLSPSLIGLLKATIKDQDSLFDRPGWALTMENGTDFCIVSVGLSIDVEKSNSDQMTIKRTAEFSPPLAPGQQHRAFLDRREYLYDGGYVDGRLIRWSITVVRGFAAAKPDGRPGAAAASTTLGGGSEHP